MVTLESVGYPTFLSSFIPVFGGHQEVPYGLASFNIYLDHNLTINIIEAFTKLLGVRVPLVDVAVVIIVVILVPAVVVLGLSL